LIWQILLTSATAVEEEYVDGILDLCKLVCQVGHIDILEINRSILVFSGYDEDCIILIVDKAMSMEGDQVNHKDVALNKV